MIKDCLFAVFPVTKERNHVYEGFNCVV